MIIVPELQVVVITPPRAASTTIRDQILARWKQAMPIYRHRERDGIPGGYTRWPVVGVMRHPLRRLLSLYHYMRAVPRQPSTQEAKDWIADCAHDTNRPFKQWLLQSQHAFHVPWVGAPKYDMLRYTAVTRRNLHDYFLPELGKTTLFRLEYDANDIEKYFDISMSERRNATNYDHSEWIAARDDEAIQKFITEHHGEDLDYYE